MNKHLLIVFGALLLTMACSKSDNANTADLNQNRPPIGPHSADECPKNIVGYYKNVDPSVPDNFREVFVLKRDDGFLAFNTSKSPLRDRASDIIVNGEQKNLGPRSRYVAVCSNKVIKIAHLTEKGTWYQTVVTPELKGIKVQTLVNDEVKATHLYRRSKLPSPKEIEHEDEEEDLTPPGNQQGDGGSDARKRESKSDRDRGSDSGSENNNGLDQLGCPKLSGKFYLNTSDHRNNIKYITLKRSSANVLLFGTQSFTDVYPDVAMNGRTISSAEGVQTTGTCAQGVMKFVTVVPRNGAENITVTMELKKVSNDELSLKNFVNGKPGNTYQYLRKK